MLWQILIPTIPHRHGKFLALLDALAPQVTPDVEVLVWRDNLEATYAEKLQGLADAATADYTSHLADDDSVSPVFIPRITAAMESRPDYIGFFVRYTEDGVVQARVVHSLAAGAWYTSPQGIARDLMYYNPIRRDLAEQVQFRGVYCDTEWADDLRRLDIVKTEVLIEEELFYYQHEVGDCFHTKREPWVGEPPELPEYPFVRYL